MERHNTKKKLNRRDVCTYIGVSAAIALSIMAVIVSLAMQVPEKAIAEEPPEKAETVQEYVQQRECEHIWQPQETLIHHEAVTRELLHPAVYQTEQVDHTICNTCGEIIDDRTAEHAASTSHTSYTTDIPTYENKVISKEWTESIVEEEAYDELAYPTEKCLLCSEVRSVEYER